MSLPFQTFNDFRIENRIHEGPYSLVYKGRQLSLDRPVLIKLLKPDVDGLEQHVQRFRQEARVCAHLRHNNIVDVYALGEEQAWHYIVMEWVSGPTLGTLLKEAKSLPPGQTLSIMDQLLLALEKTHQAHVIHRDIKPENMLIDQAGHVKLTDFGLAKIDSDQSPEATGRIVGTPAYMSPEQILGESLDFRSDLFAAGAVFYEMLCGQQAFPGESPAVCLNKVLNDDPEPLAILQPDLPEAVGDFVTKLLEKRPEDRFIDVAAARRQLSELVTAGKIELDSAKLSQLVQKIAPTGEATIFRSSQASIVGVPLAVFRQKKKSPLFWSLGLLGIIGLAMLAFVLIGDSVKQRPDTGLTADTAAVIEIAPENSGDSNMLPGAALRTGQDEENPLDRVEPIDDANDSPVQQSEPPPTGSVVSRRDSSTAQNVQRVSLQSGESDDGSSVIPAIAKLTISVRPWADIYVNETLLDSHAVEATVEIDSGRHMITLIHPNFPPQVSWVNMKGGEARSYQWSFLNNAGFLWLEVLPWGRVYIDNKELDVTPLRAPLVLSAGGHFLEIRHPAKNTFRKRIEIVPGDTLSIQVNLNAQN